MGRNGVSLSLETDTIDHDAPPCVRPAADRLTRCMCVCACASGVERELEVNVGHVAKKELGLSPFAFSELGLGCIRYNARPRKNAALRKRGHTVRARSTVGFKQV